MRSTSSFRSPQALALAALLLVTALTFVSCLGHDFLNWDDDVYVTKNPAIQKLTAEHLGQILTGYTSGNYHPVVLLASAIEFGLFGMDPRGFHLVSLLLHLANTTLVFVLLRRLDRRLIVAAVGAAFFALHPMRVESVAWVADQKDLLSALFFLAALLSWMRWRGGRAEWPTSPSPAGSGPRMEGAPEPRIGVLRPDVAGVRPKRRWYAAALILFILACGAKGTMLIFPVVLVFLDRIDGRKLDRARLTALAPFLAGSVIFGILALAARRSYEPVLMESRFGPVQEVFFGAHRLIFYYLARTLWPWSGRGALYPALGESGGLVPPGLIPALLAALLLAGVVAVCLRRAPRVAFGLLLFLLGLLPSLALPNLGYTADRFSYLPSVGLALVVGSAAGWLAVRRRLLPWVVAVPLLLLLAVRSGRQCRAWKDNVALWSDAIASYPISPDTSVNRATAYTYRGEAQAERQAWEAAISDFGAALRIRADTPRARFGRALAYEATGRMEPALDDLEQLLAALPDHREALLHAARLQYERGEYAEALRLSLRAQALGARVNPQVLEFLRAKVGTGE